MKLFNSSPLSAIRVVSFAYLRLLIFLPANLIPACALSSPAFHMMYSAYKQGDNIQPWCTPFLIWNQSVVSCLIITVASWPAYRFLRRQVRWSGIPISLGIAHSLIYFLLFQTTWTHISTFYTHQWWKQQFQSQGSIKSLSCFYTTADFCHQDLDDEVTCVVWWTRWANCSQSYFWICSEPVVEEQVKCKL